MVRASLLILVTHYMSGKHLYALKQMYATQFLHDKSPLIVPLSDLFTVNLHC
jgi:hypothetical protein